MDGGFNSRPKTRGPRPPLDGRRLAGVEGGLGSLVRDVHRAFSRELQARIVDSGVSSGQWFFLRVLWEEDGLTQRELSVRAGMMEPTTVTAVNVMERSGFVERVRNVRDRRKVNVFLTAKGRALRDELIASADELEDVAVRGVAAADVLQAVAVLRAVASNLGVDWPDGDGDETGADDPDGCDLVVADRDVARPRAPSGSGD